jgi:hypothetical protein
LPDKSSPYNNCPKQLTQTEEESFEERIIEEEEKLNPFRPVNRLKGINDANKEN